MERKEIIRDQNRIRTKKRRLLQRTENELLNNKPSTSNDTDFRLESDICSSEDDTHVDINENDFHIAEPDFDEANTGNANIQGDNIDDSQILNDQEIAGNLYGDENFNHNAGDEDNINYSSSEDEESDYDEIDVEEENHIPVEIFELRDWAINRKICQSYLDELLEILRRRLLPTLPKSSKTFLQTNSATYNIIEMGNSHGGVGHFVYYGIAEGIIKCFNPQIHETNNIELIANFDGLPISTSGTEEFWPILGKIFSKNDDYKPFPIGVFHGEGKPGNLDEYLNSFVNEVNELHENGITIGEKHYSICLKCVVADAPARAFLKNALGHCGIFSCERCTVQGVRVEGKTVFPDVNAEERTDTSFRNYTQPQHHHGPSPFLKILPAINMVAFFILDFMHLCCQGVMKRLLNYWVNGNLNTKLSLNQRNEVSKRLKGFRSQIPCEFQRKPRSLKSIAKWKATELRFFLLYAGPVVLKNIWKKDDLYNHFLLFHCAFRILCSKKLSHLYTSHAKRYLISFFICLKDFYGSASQSFNAHHLIHIADDVINMGCSLSNITCFPFENLLGKMRNYLRTAVRPLAQLSRRLFEETLLSSEKNDQVSSKITIVKTSPQGEIKSVKFNNFTISTSSPDNMVLCENGSIMQVKKITKEVENHHSLLITGNEWEKESSIFVYHAILLRWICGN